MSRQLTTLSLGALALFLIASIGKPQPPGGKGDAKKADVKKADAPDTVLEAALANDPDVRMARAKMQLAEAEWVKARQAVTAKVLTLRSLIADQKRAFATADEAFKLVSKAFAAGNIATAEMLAAREKLEAAQSNLARSEMELKLVTGGAGVPPAHGALACPMALKGATNCTACHTAQVGLERLALDVISTARLEALSVLSLRGAKAASGPVADRLKAALDKSVTLSEKAGPVSFDKAVEVFKKAGLDVPVRIVLKMGSVSQSGEELTIGAWLQMFADETPDCLMLVRDYGLLVTGKTLNPPPDAMSVFDLWKQKPAEKK